MAGDTDKNCYVNLIDLAELANNWLKCNDPEDPNNCDVGVDVNEIAVWHMDEGAGTLASDGDNATAFSPVGTGIGAGMTWTSPGYDGSGYAIQKTTTASNSYLQATLNFDLTYYLKVEVWIKPEVYTIDIDGGNICGLEETFLLHFGPPHPPWPGGPENDTMRFLVRSGSDWLEGCIVAGADALFDGNWHKITCIYDGIPDEYGKINLEMFWDDNRVAAAAFAESEPRLIGRWDGGPWYNLYLGTNPWNPGVWSQTYVGAIDELGISNKPGLLSSQCGDFGYLTGDTNKDCYVDLADVADFSSDWLKCTDPCDPTNCEIGE